MGGFTEIFLKNRGAENISKQNELLREYGVPKKYKFYSDEDRMKEYIAFKRGEGVFPEHLFPRDKINSFNDFKKYWSPEAIGSCFCPHNGTLTFDCYFGRTSKRAMRSIGKYLAANHSQIEKVEGSFDTFMERGMTKKEIEQIKKSEIIFD